MVETSRRFGTLLAHDIEDISGCETLRRMAAGELPVPPICRVLEFMITAVEPGSVTFEGAPSIAFANPLGTTHGGWAATLLDSCMGCAVHSRLEVGQSYTTLEIKVNYTRAMGAETGPVRAVGKVLHMGRRIATAEGKLLDRADRLLAHGSTTCVVFAA
ncbi:MAG: PaaI family thioesterase [Geminicoccaceae bacterium]